MTPSTDDRPSRDPEAVYRERSATFAAQRDEQAGRSDQLASLRIFTFIGALALLLWVEVDPSAPRVPLVALAVVLLVLFVALIAGHDRIKRRIRWFDELRRLNDAAIARRDRDWESLAPSPLPAPGADHPYAHDLDLFGPASLSQVLGPVATPGGRDRLRRWLLSPAAPAEIAARQRAVAELADRIDLRDTVAARGRIAGSAPSEVVDRFLSWAEESPWLRSRRALLWTTRLLPVATVVLATLRISGIVAGHYWIVPIAAGLVLSRIHRDALAQTLDRAAARSDLFRSYADRLWRVRNARLEAPRLDALQDRMSGASAAADTHLRRLERLIGMAGVRFSSFHRLIHVLTLVDFHLVDALERWKRRAGGRVRRWLGALAEFEALSALAALAHAEPSWTYPKIDRGDETIAADGLAHPLLPGSIRVGNDVRVGPPGTLLLVTGSNMSGKSTLLRAVGTNVVLAQAGAPVCADGMRLPPIRLHTSIRVQDSLERGISFFLAELQRLKQVVDAARTARQESRTLLYLLDEMLQGTNARERRIAARRILRHLLAQGAIGAVTTHDLQLVDAPDLRPARRDVHFSETLRQDGDRPVLSFDYTLRPGVATTTNALTLMEAIGLDVDGDDDETG